MKATVLCLFALLGAAGTPMAGEPLVLTEAQLDEVTAGKATEEYGGIVILTTNLKAFPSFEFSASSRTAGIEVILGGFTEVGPGQYEKVVPPAGGEVVAP